MLNGVIHGIKSEITGPCYSPTGNKEIIAVSALSKIEPIVKFLGEKEFLVGDYVTWMDFYFYEFIQFISFLTDTDVFVKYPILLKYVKHMENLAGLKEYLASDKFMVKPFNGTMAKVNNL